MADQFDKNGKRKRVNEGKCCDAIVCLLERRTGYTRENITLNAKAKNSEKDVEIRLTLGQQDYAIEHTVISSLDDIGKHKCFREIREHLKNGSFPIPGRYMLALGVIPAKAEMTALEIWVQQAAKELYELSKTATSERSLQKTGTPWGQKYEVKLYRESMSSNESETSGILDVRWYDKNNDLLTTITKALEDKCPKLKSHKNTGAISILVLEILGNNTPYQDIYASLRDAQRDDLPDEIFIIETIVNKWFVIQTKQGNEYPESPGRVAEEFSPNELEDITG